MSDQQQGDHRRPPEDRGREESDADDTTMAQLAQLLGAPDLDQAERAAVLDLTRVVAHTVQRRFGPLAAYALGLAVGAGADPRDRTTALREAAARLEATAAGDAGDEPA